MTSSIRRRRRVLAISVIVVASAPWFFVPQPEAGAQVDTTSTTAPATTTTTTTTTTTLPPTTTTTPRTTTTRRVTTTTTTTTTLPPTTTTTSTTTTTTTTTVPRSTTTLEPTTTTIPSTTTIGFVPLEDPADGDPGDSGLAGLPSWSLPFIGAGAMLAAILVATGVIRLATQGIPSIGRQIGAMAYRTSNRWARWTTRRTRASVPTPVVRRSIGSRIAGFFLALTAPFRRIGNLFTRRDSSPRRLRTNRRSTVGGLWARIVLRGRMTRARLNRTRSSVDGQKRYWWLRFRRYIPWLR